MINDEPLPGEVSIQEEQLSLPKTLGRKKRRPSIIPTNVNKEIDTSSWTLGAKRGIAVNEIKAKYPEFLSRVKQKVFPPYVYDNSIESAQVNKHVFELIKAKTIPIAWPSIQEEKKARRKLPVPVSLTGFGLDDGRSAKYWSHRLREAVKRVESSLQEVHSENLLDNVPPSVKAILETSNPEELKGGTAELKEWYDKAKKELQLRQQLEQEKLPQEVQFPYKVAMELRSRLNKEIEDLKSEMVSQQQTETRVELLDKEYDEYMKHRKVLSVVSSNLSPGVSKPEGTMTPEEFDSEMEMWKEQFWRRSYGSANPTIPPSTTPCGGCGAIMHCTDPSIPGYLPSEKFVSMSDNELKREKCQRCEYLDHFNVSVDVTVDPDSYPQILAKIRDEGKSIVIIMVDLLDFPCSIWPDVMKLVGKHKKIFVVGNKVDLLPRDGKFHLERIEEALKKSLPAAGMDESNEVYYRDVSLISAKTGYGIERLITKLYRTWNREEDIYLLGCTNVGKSTLFNALLQSDLCAVRENDLIQRATTSLWPGTTLNLLKFPINKIEGWQMELRNNRLTYMTRVKAEEHELRRSLWKQEDNPTQENIMNRIGMTFREEVPFTKESNHPFAKRSQLPKPFDEKDYHYLDSKYFYDSPGTIYNHQILSLLTTEELIKTIPRKTITPRVFSLQPFQTLFIAGLARIDVVHSRQNVLLTVFASDYLPIHVVYTNQASRFYNIFLGTELLKVPFGPTERLNQWPVLTPKEIDFTAEDSKSWKESCGDIVLSNAGWVSVTMGLEEACVLKAYTPEGRGIFVRKPSLLPFAVNMKGRRHVGTPCYDSRVVSNDEYYERDGEYKWDDKQWILQQKYRKEASNANAMKAYKQRSYAKGSGSSSHS